MSKEARLTRVLAFLREKGWKCTYNEEDGCGSIDFEYRGVETNLRHGGRQEEIFGDYETELLEILKGWGV